MTETDPVHARRLEHLGLAAVLIAALLVWLPALRCGFTSWDDPAFCVANPDVANPDLRTIFDPHHWVVSDWTPLAILSYAAERALLGAEPWVPHATNVLLHVLSVYLAFRLLREIGLSLEISLFATLVYALHPLQAESVVWVSARKNVLMAVFSLAFLRSYVAGRHAWATLWFGLSLCSKATGVGLPLVAVVIDRLGLGVPRGRRTYAWIAGWLVLSVARGLVSVEAQADPVARTAVLGFAGRMAMMGSVFTTQLRQVFAPYDLCVVYVTPQRSWSDPALLGQWAVVAAAGIAGVILAIRDRRLAAVGAFSLVMLAPTANLLPGPCLQADRYLQMPLIGIGVFLAASLRPLARLHRAVPAAVLTIWIGAVCVPCTLVRIETWRTDESLWEDARRKQPDSSAAWNYTGLLLAKNGDLPGAIAAFRRCLAIRPDLEFAELNLAVALVGDHRDSEAESIARRLTASSEVGGEAHGLLGFVLARRGELAAAGDEFEVARRLAPDSERVRDWFNAVAGSAMQRR